MIYWDEKNEYTAKIVYFGPQNGGKATNLMYLSGQKLPSGQGAPADLNHKDPETYLFVPLQLEIKGTRVNLHLYTLHSNAAHPETIRILIGTDVLVFVADAQGSQMPANRKAIDRLCHHQLNADLKLDGVSVILQLNKLDVEGSLSLEQAVHELNWRGHTVEAKASLGIGVHETLKACIRLLDFSRAKVL